MCRAEAPHLSQLQKKYENQGLTVLAVNADHDSNRRLKEFAVDENLSHKILVQGHEVAFETYSCRAFPTQYWIDRSGKLVARDYGYENYREMEATAKKLLKKRG